LVSELAITLLGNLALLSLMATQAGRERRCNRMGGFRDERDDKFQALQRQVEQLTLRLECQEARSEHGEESRGSSSDESDVNPFSNHGKRRFFRDFETLNIDLPEF
jgi:hypothetical protein